MRNMPRVYRSFEEFARDELNNVDEELSIDEMLDEMFADDLNIDFKGQGQGRSQVKANSSALPEIDER